MEWDGAVRRGVSAWSEITGAVVGRGSKGEGKGEWFKAGPGNEYQK